MNLSIPTLDIGIVFPSVLQKYYKTSHRNNNKSLSIISIQTYIESTFKFKLSLGKYIANFQLDVHSTQMFIQITRQLDIREC